MIKRILCINKYKDFSSNSSWNGHTGDISNGELITWGMVSGLTNNSIVEYYTGQTESEAIVASIPILLTSTIDDIGFLNSGCENFYSNTTYTSGNTVIYNENTYVCITNHISDENFNPLYWHPIPINQTSGNTITYIGESKINEFRRYGKTEDDPDLYNPTWNTGFTNVITDPNGIIKKITGENENGSVFDKQKLYNYEISLSGKTGTTISYSDIGMGYSEISYVTNGLTKENSIESQPIKLDYLNGIINSPKINIDVFIDRGSNSSFDRHLRLGDIKSITDLENYGNGYFKLKEN